MSVGSNASAVVYIVEDDPSVRAAISRLIRSTGLHVQLFGSAQQFLSTQREESPACLVVDVRLPGLNGLELQQILASQDAEIPIIFITGHGDIPMSVRAMKAGAVEFLTKPFQDQDLLDAIQSAIEGDRTARQQRAEIAALQQLRDSLTPRENEVFALVARGLPNKQIAAQLGASEKTIKVHRGKVMSKMKAESLAALVRMADKLGIIPPGTASTAKAGQ
jgi:RNA polymerase sigma factor (sigma-70 family)